LAMHDHQFKGGVLFQKKRTVKNNRGRAGRTGNTSGDAPPKRWYFLKKTKLKMGTAEKTN